MFLMAISLKSLRLGSSVKDDRKMGRVLIYLAKFIEGQGKGVTNGLLMIS